MLSVIQAATLQGVEARAVRVEVHVGQGLPSFTVVGQPDTACREARDRVRAALLTCERSWPGRRITVNLAPSGIRKVGAGLDLAIAIGLLAADEQIELALTRPLGLLGELGLDGSVRRVPGLLSLVEATAADDVVVPAEGYHEAALIGGRRLRPVADLPEVVAALTGEGPWPEPPPRRAPPDPPPEPDLVDVRGQASARRAIEVAAAGGHHLLFVGPPGAGKTMLARRLPALLPDLAADTALEVTRVHSVATTTAPVEALMTRPPFRAPHFGASAVAVVGGGTGAVQPGEISLAHASDTVKSHDSPRRDLHPDFVGPHRPEGRCSPPGDGVPGTC